MNHVTHVTIFGSFYSPGCVRVMFKYGDMGDMGSLFLLPLPPPLWYKVMCLVTPLP